ncbi:Esa1p-associated factor [Apophysomyces sp. BC1034]|nr:Esa1p-associated factor [Apophysomyces sp. BC1015]KAG0174189.1 Esa1p-associated factor [Apophysomyces sp. BC1021]KAG0185706.1 Esa1p-associated factor [Apophysomyces sp. BC1034]
MAQEDTSDKKLQFEEEEKVLCFHGPLLYEAKILSRQWLNEDPELHGPYYYVHYKGWKRTWDEWVPESRVLRWNDTNLAMQRQLKELYTGKSKSRGSSSTASPGPDQQAGKKRSRDSSIDKQQEDDFLNKPEIRVDIPDTLKGQLVDDWENVTKNQQLISLPRDPNVSEILARYKRFKKEKKSSREVDEDLLEEVLHGVRIYFNKALGTMLLYRFERHQYADIRKQYPEREMVDIYGAEHLLRLFVQMPSLIAHTDMDSDAVGVLTDHLTDILKYMQKTQKNIFLNEYENATPGYVSLTNSS